MSSNRRVSPIVLSKPGYGVTCHRQVERGAVIFGKTATCWSNRFGGI